MRATAGAIVVGLVLLTVAGAAAFVYVKRREIGESIGDAAAAAGQAINPLSDENIFHQGASAVASAVTGDSVSALGTKWWELWNPGQAAADNAAFAPIETKKPSASSLTWLADLDAIDRNDMALGLDMRGASDFATTPGGAATGRRILH